MTSSCRKPTPASSVSTCPSTPPRRYVTIVVIILSNNLSDLSYLHTVGDGGEAAVCDPQLHGDGRRLPHHRRGHTGVEPRTAAGALRLEQMIETVLY